MPRLDVFWHFSNIVIKGKRVESFPFELLLEVFKGIPGGAGEDAFWKTVDATDFNALYDRLTREMQEEWARQDRLERRRLSRLNVILWTNDYSNKEVLAAAREITVFPKPLALELMAARSKNAEGEFPITQVALSAN